MKKFIKKILIGLLATSAQALANDKICSDEGICQNHIFIIGNEYVKIINVNDNNTYRVAYLKGGLTPAYSLKSDDFFQTWGCLENICVGEQYIFANKIIKIAGVSNLLKRYKATTSDNNIVPFGIKKTEIKRIASQEYKGFNYDWFQYLTIQDVEYRLKDISIVLYPNKAEALNKIIELMTKMKTTGSDNNFWARLFILNSIRPLIENNTSQVFTENIIPEYKKFILKINSDSQTQSLSDIGLSQSTLNSSLYIMYACLGQIISYESDLERKQQLQLLNTKIGIGLASLNRNDAKGVIDLYKKLDEQFSNYRLSYRIKDFVLITDTQVEFLKEKL